jgi:molybdopterin converting factor small subunit
VANDQSPVATAPASTTTVTVILPAALLRLFPEAEGRLEVVAPTVGAMLDELEGRWPGMRDRLRDSSPAIRRHISVFVEGARAKLDTPLKPGTRVYVLTAISGG